MIRRELAKDPKLATEPWDRFLPNFRKRHLKTSEKTAKKNEKEKARAEKLAEIHGTSLDEELKQQQKEKNKKKVYTPFPPPQQLRKVSATPTVGQKVSKKFSDGFANGVGRVLPQNEREKGERGCIT